MISVRLYIPVVKDCEDERVPRHGHIENINNEERARKKGKYWG